jgi:hypothetical protein
MGKTPYDFGIKLSTFESILDCCTNDEFWVKTIRLSYASRFHPCKLRVGGAGNE